jgi:hypothetical protein
LRIYHPLEFMPLAMVATALAIREPSMLRVRGRRRRLNACLALALLISLWGAHASRSLLPTGGLYPKHPPFLHRPDRRARQIHELLLAVPSERIVATSYMLCAPLSGREWLFHTELPPQAELFIAARGYLGAPVETYAEAKNIMLRLAREALESGRWRLARPYEPGPQGLGLLWLERGENARPLSSKEIDGILADLERVEPK